LAHAAHDVVGVITTMKRIALALVLTLSMASMSAAQTPQTSGVVVRQSDSLWNGAIIGAGAGVASGLFFCTRMEPWDNCRDDYGAMFKFGAIGAGIGMGIDALIRKSVFQSASGATQVHASPILSRRGKGLRLSLRF
jgi:hypothetical protein